MSKEFIVKKCMKCGAIVKVIEDCTCDNCGIQCCGEQMRALVPNSVDASFEKHVPTYEVHENSMTVKVNHVMEDEHHIEWIAAVYENSEKIQYFKPGEEAIMECAYVPGTTLYSYCNNHGLWKADVK